MLDAEDGANTLLTYYGNGIMHGITVVPGTVPNPIKITLTVSRTLIER